MKAINERLLPSNRKQAVNILPIKDRLNRSNLWMIICRCTLCTTAAPTAFSPLCSTPAESTWIRAWFQWRLLVFYVNTSKPNMTHTVARHHRRCAPQKTRMCPHSNRNTVHSSMLEVNSLFSHVHLVFPHHLFPRGSMRGYSQHTTKAKKQKTGSNLCATVKDGI